MDGSTSVLYTMRSERRSNFGMALNLALVSTNGNTDASLTHALSVEGVSFTTLFDLHDLSEAYNAALLVLKRDEAKVTSDVVQRCKELSIPLIGVVLEENLPDIDLTVSVTDFVVIPPRKGELVARLRRATNHGDEQSQEGILQAGNLRIDTRRYEVFNQGLRLLLTFKEYQLLCLLASNSGRVFTRENLLSQIWGYDYYGGPRTVDVHIRRLRSKIEERGQAYIETVRNVGYRFRSA